LFLDNINLAASSIPDGLNDYKGLNATVKVYPNPSNGVANVLVNTKSTQAATISVMNALGQLVYEKQIQLNGGNTATQIDLSALSGGIYTVLVNGTNLRAVSKITLQN
jgi:hypothetical protein